MVVIASESSGRAQGRIVSRPQRASILSAFLTFVSVSSVACVAPPSLLKGLGEGIGEAFARSCQVLCKFIWGILPTCTGYAASILASAVPLVNGTVAHKWSDLRRRHRLDSR